MKQIQKIFVLTAVMILSQSLLALENIHSNPSKRISKNFFIENKGQWPEEVRFLAKIGGMRAWVTDEGIVYDFYKVEYDQSIDYDSLRNAEPMDWMAKRNELARRKGHVVQMSFVNSRKFIKSIKLESEKLKVDGINKLEAYYNYFIGNDSTKWASFVSLYEEVLIKNVYEGIDYRLYFDDGLIRYDIIAKPYADLEQLKIKYDGQNGLEVNESGELAIKTRIGDVVNQKIYAYQANRKIECKFSIDEENLVRFDIEDYDKSLALTIDPLVWSTFIGGTGNEPTTSLKRDATGNLLLSGYSYEGGFPTTVGAYEEDYSGTIYYDAYLCKLSEDGSDLLFSTYLGGSDGGTNMFEIALDASGNVYCAGHSSSQNFPSTPGVYDETVNGPPGSTSSYVCKFSSDGSSLVFSTFIGGNSGALRAIALDSSYNVYVAGMARSSAYPTTSGAFREQKSNSNWDMVVSILNSNGTSLLYSTYIGGDSSYVPNNYGSEAHALTIDGANNVYVTGYTMNTDFPTTSGAFDSTHNGNYDIAVMKFSSDLSTLIYSTYLGAEENDHASDITLDGFNNAYLTGSTRTGSNLFPTTSSAYDTSFNGSGADIFVSKLNSDGSDLIYSTYIGGDDYDVANGIELDDDNSAYIVGYSGSSDFPTTAGAYDETNNGLQDGIICKLSSDGSELLYSSLIGGQNNDNAIGLVLTDSLNAYINGYTESFDLPTTSGAYDEDYEEDNDVFVLKFNVTGCPGFSPRERDSCALVALYNATDGDNWTDNTNWMSDTEPMNNWYGVFLTPEGRVRELHLRDNGVKGYLPEELSLLEELINLFLGFNDLSGTIPSSFGNLKKLKTLNLYRAPVPGTPLGGVTGTIPPQLGDIDSLQYLYLENNQLDTLPSGLGNAKELIHMRIYRNKLNCTIPLDLGGLSNLKELLLNKNDSLHGQLPDTLGNLTNLEYLNLSYCNLSGSIPSNFQNLDKLKTLDIRYNNLTGTIPPELGNVDSLKYLYLEFNNLDSLPIGLGNAKELIQLWIHDNNLNCIIPEDLGSLSKLRVLLLNNNDSLHGPIPDTLGKLNSLTGLNLSNCDLSGSFPLSFNDQDSLRSLYISGNKINYFPDLSSIGNLTTLNIQDNRLEFDDIETNLFVQNFIYSPQDSVGIVRSDTVCLGSYDSLSVTVGGANNLYEWFIDGESVSDTSPNHYLIIPEVTGNDTGSYYCHVTNSMATELILYCRPISLTLKETPAPQITDTDNSFTSCENQVCKYSCNASDVILWNVENGIINGDSDKDSVNVLWGSSGSGTITLYQLKNNGCDATTLQEVIIHPLPDIPIVNDTTIIKGDSATLMATSPANSIIRWYDSETDGTELATGYTYQTESLDDTIGFYVESEDSTTGCISETRAKVTVTVQDPGSIIVLMKSSNEEICKYESVEIGIRQAVTGGVPPYTFSWSPDYNLSSSTDSIATASPDVTTEYTLKVTDSRGDSSKANVMVKINQLPDAPEVQNVSIYENQDAILR
ncbi:SBBP repeat-containing protein, partial [Bacteroidota bacterium]